MLCSCAETEAFVIMDVTQLTWLSVNVDDALAYKYYMTVLLKVSGSFQADLFSWTKSSIAEWSCFQLNEYLNLVSIVVLSRVQQFNYYKNEIESYDLCCLNP